MTTTIALFGAAGNMGTRISNTLKDDPEYRLLHVEAGEPGRAKLKELTKAGRYQRDVY